MRGGGCCANKQRNKQYYMTGVGYGGRVPISENSLGRFESPACFAGLLSPIQSGFEAWPLTSFYCPRMYLVIHKNFKYVFEFAANTSGESGRIPGVRLQLKCDGTR